MLAFVLAVAFQKKCALTTKQMEEIGIIDASLSL